jgi:hypothetical protein
VNSAVFACKYLTLSQRGHHRNPSTHKRLSNFCEFFFVLYLQLFTTNGEFAMAGNRKYGFLRGNAGGRNGSRTLVSWQCFGCDKQHAGRTNRTLMGGKDYCDKKYFAIKEAQFLAERESRKTIFAGGAKLDDAHQK